MISETVDGVMRLRMHKKKDNYGKDALMSGKVGIFWPVRAAHSKRTFAFVIFMRHQIGGVKPSTTSGKIWEASFVVSVSSRRTVKPWRPSTI